MLGAKMLAARAVGALARRLGRGGGTSLPGRVLIRLQPDAIERLAARLARGSVVISATNGKTTTAAIAAAILARARIPLVHNREGANMAGGVASTLLQAAGPGGRLAGELGVFEVDEFWLAALVDALHPRVVVLGNLFRDQLDRYGELETIAERWAAGLAALPDQARLVLNADDPLVADLADGQRDVCFFGVQDRSLALGQMQHAADSKHCRRCGAAYVYEAVYLGHLGIYRCPSCGRRRPEPQISATEVELDGIRASRFTLQTPVGTSPVVLPLPGLYNVYNALGAVAMCLALDVDLPTIVEALAGVEAAFGRAETIMVGSRQLSLLLIKNPAGANEVLRTLALEDGELQLLAVLNDRIADGRDVSWIWDADFELLRGRVRRCLCSGTRATELALRLKYAGVPVGRLEVQPDLGRALDRALDGSGGQLYALPTYTGLLELREELSRRGHVTRYWAPHGNAEAA